MPINSEKQGQTEKRGLDQTAPAAETWAKGQLMTNEAVTRGQGPKTSK